MFNSTALMIASAHGDIEIVQMILLAGADVNLKNSKDNTALMIAGEKGYTQIVNLLKETGAEE